MADEIKDSGAASNVDAITTGATGLPAEALAQAGSKIPPQEKPPIEEAHIIEETIVKPSPAPKSAPPSAPPPPAPAAQAAPPPVSPQSQAVQPPSSREAPSPIPPAAPDEYGKERETIANILKEIKLPERRTQDAPKEVKVFDTTLGVSRSAEPSAAPPIVPPSPASIGTGVSAIEESAQATMAKGEDPAANSTLQKASRLADGIVSPLRTLKNDLQEIIRVKKISLVKAAALESEKHRNRDRDTEEQREMASEGRSYRSFGILFAAALFLSLGAAAFFGVFLIMGERSGTPARAPQSDILFAENGVPFPLEKSSSIELKRLLSQARVSGGGTLGSITRVIPVVTETNAEGVAKERGATLEEFLRALGARAPDELFRALPNEFFFGIHTVDENAPLFVIPVLSYERAFAAMLRWEDTMNADLSPAFTAVPDQTLGASGLPEKRRFEDVVMRNYDVRVLKDDAGTIELYYSFPTRELLIIAESPYSFTEILSRLRAERKL